MFTLSTTQILLHTMHKYTMKIVVEQVDSCKKTVIPLPDTTFIAVSAYQNVELIGLKISNNPCANAFKHRSSGYLHCNGMMGHTPCSPIGADNGGQPNEEEFLLDNVVGY